MKWWQIILLILAFLIIVRVIVYAVTINAAAKIAASNPDLFNTTPSSLQSFNNFGK